MTVELYCGDCLDIMPTLPGPFAAIITDLPYGTTACKWDVVIPFAPMWAQVKRLLAKRGAFVTTASQPFTSALIMSNLAWFRYELIWDKSLPTGHLDANRKPLRRHENVLVFSQNGHVYNPQMTTRGRPRDKGNAGGIADGNSVYHAYHAMKSYNNTYFPTSIIVASNAAQSDKEHPTQKPVALYEYLIRTYTNAGDTVLDCCMGSGTTGVACVKTGRRFVGIEKDPAYFAIAERRIKEAQAQLRLEGL